MKKHDGCCSQNLVFAMSIMNDHPHSHHENANGVDESVKKKSSCFISVQRFADRVNHRNPIGHVLREKIKNNVEGNKPGACEYTQPSGVLHDIKKDTIVFYTCMQLKFR